jgi:hypothetical protein
VQTQAIYALRDELISAESKRFIDVMYDGEQVKSELLGLLLKFNSEAHELGSADWEDDDDVVMCDPVGLLGPVPHRVAPSTGATSDNGATARKSAKKRDAAGVSQDGDSWDAENGNNDNDEAAKEEKQSKKETDWVYDAAAKAGKVWCPSPPTDRSSLALILLLSRTSTRRFRLHLPGPHPFDTGRPFRYQRA